MCYPVYPGGMPAGLYNRLTIEGVSMNEKEVAEIRRRFRLEKSNITHIRGCFVNDQREIVSEFDQSLLSMSQEESETFLSILKRTLSGTLGKNLLDITFETRQVVEGTEHKLLMELKNSALQNEEAVQAFFQQAIQSVSMEGNYLVLLAYDTYDIPYRSKSGENLEDASSEVYSYFLCGVCPIKLTKPALGYFPTENVFHHCKEDWIVSPPELGFLFPAFDDRSANIYNALYYTRDIKEIHAEFIEAVFRTAVPMPAAEQKERFQAVLSEALAGAGGFDAVQSVHGRLCELMEEHKANKEEDPLLVSKRTVEGVLQSCGIPEESVTAFGEKYDAAFGENTALSPRNLVDTKKFEVQTPDVTISVSAACSDMVQTRVIDGAPYLLIRADANVEVNGIKVRISDLPPSDG